MKSRLFSGLTISAIAIGALLALDASASATPINDPGLLALHCSTGYFCAWDNHNFGGYLLVQSRAASGSKVDAPNDRVSSGSNHTGNTWVGRNSRTGFPDQTIYTWAPLTEVAYVGDSGNDKIDHFDVR